MAKLWAGLDSNVKMGWIEIVVVPPLVFPYRKEKWVGLIGSI